MELLSFPSQRLDPATKAERKKYGALVYIVICQQTLRTLTGKKGAKQSIVSNDAKNPMILIHKFIYLLSSYIANFSPQVNIYPHYWHRKL